MRRRERKFTMVEMQMGPMIDMVFLLLVFFMVTARPTAQESDISLGLPGSAPQDEPVDLPDDQRIVITQSGSVVLNEAELGPADDRELARLVATLRRFREAAEAAKSDAMVTLDPHDAVIHQRVVDVLNACAKAGVHGVSFADGGSGS